MKDMEADREAVVGKSFDIDPTPEKEEERSLARGIPRPIGANKLAKVLSSFIYQFYVYVILEYVWYW